jgi:hypothetical protein
MVRRREFIKIVAGSAIGTLPLPSYAQQAAMPVVGFINAASAENYRLPFSRDSRKTDMSTGKT